MKFITYSPLVILLFFDIDDFLPETIEANQ